MAVAVVVVRVPAGVGVWVLPVVPVVWWRVVAVVPGVLVGMSVVSRVRVWVSV
ncbi:hypothetical protein [Streptomyces aureus]|uniref:hypothetical protein n=1 Tax=Streptomyces aureus TaxID=193461 RepID=UPI00368ADB6D